MEKNYSKRLQSTVIWLHIPTKIYPKDNGPGKKQTFFTNGISSGGVGIATLRLLWVRVGINQMNNFVGIIENYGGKEIQM